MKRSNCIGFHTGDLPGDRGGSPIQHKILRGEYDTFVSAMKLVNEIDAGDLDFFVTNDYREKHGYKPTDDAWVLNKIKISGSFY